MQNIIEYTWKEISELDKERSILFVTVAPIEQHSLCLPLGTDVYEGESWIESAAIKLEKSEEAYRCFKLPAFPVACASVTGFYGCIHFKPQTTYNVVKELMSNIACWNFKNVIVIASHADPIHQVAVEKACEWVNEKYGVCAFSPMGAFFSAEGLGINLKYPQEVCDLENKAGNDYHAGWLETSMMLDIHNELVRKDYEKLPDTYITEKEMISEEKQLKAMGEYGHMGSPRFADKYIGKLLNENVSEYLQKVIKCFVKRDGYEKYMHHFLYKMPFMHKYFL